MAKSINLALLGFYFFMHFTQSQAQERIHISHACQYDGDELEIKDLFVFPAENKMVEAVREIKSLVRLQSEFDVKSGNVNNAIATVQNGRRMIVYSRQFLLEMERNGKWPAYAILAHEIAHHLEGHPIVDGHSSMEHELQADEWSGYALAKLGATLDQALIAVKSLPEQGSSTHPAKSARIEAIIKGWQDGQPDPIVIDFNNNKTPTSLVDKKTVYFQGGPYILRRPSNIPENRYGTLTKDQSTLNEFHIASHEVTFDEFDVFCRDTGRSLPDDMGLGRGRKPVVNVSIEDVEAYIIWIRKKTGIQWRLPTEEEWMYAASDKGLFTPDANTLERIAWIGMNSGINRLPPEVSFSEVMNSKGETHAVGSKPSYLNDLYDIWGNVGELCSDKVTIPGEYTFNVVKGGNYASRVTDLQVYLRDGLIVGRRSPRVGFRLCYTPQKP